MPIVRFLSALALCATALTAQADTAQIRAQTFTLDPAHSTVVFSVNHLGLTDFTASFDDISASLDLDPAAPASARLTARIAAASLDLPAPPPGFLDEMLGAVWFDAGAHPEITFTSTAIDRQSDTGARITGTLTLRGRSAPIEMTARYNTSFAAGLIEPHPRIGFSATGTLNRSDFGMTSGLPAEGTTFGVGDAVNFTIEAEFTGTAPPD